jgi:hypothetical protein
MKNWAIRRLNELAVEHCRSLRCPVPGNRNRRRVGDRLRDKYVFGLRQLGCGSEHVERTDRGATGARRQRVHRPEPVGISQSGEPGPAVIDRGELQVHDWLGGDKSVHARFLIRLELEQLEPNAMANSDELLRHVDGLKGSVCVRFEPLFD